VPGTPYTLEAAMRPRNDAREITHCAAPFRVHSVNVAWEQLTGRKLSDVIGRPGFTSIDTGLAQSMKLQHIRSGIATRGVAMLNVACVRDGGFVELRLCVSPLLGPNGSVTHLLGVLTEMKG